MRQIKIFQNGTCPPQTCLRRNVFKQGQRSASVKISKKVKSSIRNSPNDEADTGRNKDCCQDVILSTRFLPGMGLITVTHWSNVGRERVFRILHGFVWVEVLCGNSAVG